MPHRHAGPYGRGPSGDSGLVALALLTVLMPLAAGCILTSSDSDRSAPDPNHPEAQVTPPSDPTPCTTDGTFVRVAEAFTYVHGGRTFYFCSDDCIGKFQQNPRLYLADATQPK